MMTSSDLYLVEKTTEQLGEMFDLAVCTYQIDGDRFWDHFVRSEEARQFEEGNCRLILGRSASENAKEILEKAGEGPVELQAFCRFDRSAEYWTGWILAGYQLHSGMSFRQIHRMIHYRELLSMYPAYHEAPPERFFEEMDRRRKSAGPGLKRQREARGLSQSELARESGVGLKSIQAYEQGWKTIGHARTETLLELAKALDCLVEDLL